MPEPQHVFCESAKIRCYIMQLVTTMIVLLFVTRWVASDFPCIPCLWKLSTQLGKQTARERGMCADIN